MLDALCGAYRYWRKKSCSLTPHHVVLSGSCFHLWRAIEIFTVVLAWWQFAPHHPFLTWSAFHLRMLVFSLLLTWRQTLYFLAHSFLSLSLNISVDEMWILLVVLLSFSSNMFALTAHCGVPRLNRLYKLLSEPFTNRPLRLVQSGRILILEILLTYWSKIHYWCLSFN